MERSNWCKRTVFCRRSLSKLLMLLFLSCSSVRLTRSLKTFSGSWSKKLLERSSLWRAERLEKACSDKVLSWLLRKRKVLVLVGMSKGMDERPKPLQSTSRVPLLHLQEEGHVMKLSAAQNESQQANTAQEKRKTKHNILKHLPWLHVTTVSPINATVSCNQMHKCLHHSRIPSTNPEDGFLILLIQRVLEPVALCSRVVSCWP